MNNVSELLQVTERYLTAREDARSHIGKGALCFDADTPDGVPLEVRSAPAGEITVQRVDFATERLAYLQLSRLENGKRMTEVYGALLEQDSWKLMTCLRAPTPEPPRPFLFTAEQADRLHEIARVLGTYLDSVCALDADTALHAFYPGAKMAHPDAQARILRVPVTVFYERWAGLPSPESLGIEKFTQIHHIELLSPRVAVAKVGMTKLKEHFIDVLCCMEIGGTWKIVNKLTDLAKSHETDRRHSGAL